MESYTKTYEATWADMDPNRHMRHSVYNDYAAHTRVSMFQDYGLSISDISEMGLGPILFREETKFHKEINLSETIRVSCKLKSMLRDGSRWTFRHEIFNENDTKAAEIIVDGAWLDLSKRELGTPPEELVEVLDRFPKTDDFKWVAEKST